MIEQHQVFLEHRRQQEKELSQKDAVVGLFDAVLTIEINTTELCNRACSFCPRVDPEVYPNRNLHISEKTVRHIIKDLQRLRFNKKVSFSGFGEPLLYKDFPWLIKEFRQHLPSVLLETNTNGDRLTSDTIKHLFDSGLNMLYINAYDGPEQIPFFEEMIAKSQIDISCFKLRPHWTGVNQQGLILNNRSGALAHTIQILPLKQQCFYPFYKMFIDYNGDVLSCSNDWLRKKIIGNVHNTGMEDIWADISWNDMRRNLLAQDRSELPCKTCDVNGVLFGSTSVEKFFNNGFK